MFGTCGNSTWRKEMFIPFYESMGLEEGKDFYNPQVDDWKPELAEIEAEHLATDDIILFPITHETYGMGSLAETGFSILQAIKFDDRRDLIILIDNYLDQKLMNENSIIAKESLRARALVKQHLNKLRFSNLYVVETMEDMLHLSYKLFEIKKQLKIYQDKFNIKG